MSVRSALCVARLAGLWLIAVSLPGALSQEPAHAQELRPAQPPCACEGPQNEPRRAPRPKYADHSREPLGIEDEVAALDAIRIALTQAGDGSSFIWHRDTGRLSGLVQPTRSFKDASGRVCRHIIVILTTGRRTGRIEGIACRLADGVWQLGG